MADPVCPVVNTFIVAPCRLRNCRYWLNYEWSCNCLLRFLTDHSVDSLSPQEIAFTHQLPADVVEAEVLDAVSAIRGRMLLEDLPPQYSMLPITSVCCACESAIDDPAEALLADGGFAYCSADCRQDLPASVLLVERSFGQPVEKVLRACLHRFPSISTLEQVLGLGRAAIRSLCQRYSIADVERTRRVVKAGDGDAEDASIDAVTAVRDRVYRRWGAPPT